MLPGAVVGELEVGASGRLNDDLAAVTDQTANLERTAFPLSYL